MNLPQDVNDILSELNKNNFEAYVVGGCVRDVILGKTPKDWDITTSAKPEDVKKIFPHTFDTGIKHGTVTVVLNKENYEVTTYRIEGDYVDFRRPSEVFFTNDITLDLERRDFTINAIAYHPQFGFVDPFFGKEDMDNKLIKGVGNAEARFNEDALRMMRALRFSCQLNFSIEEKTFLAIQKLSPLIKKISFERIRDEFVKMLYSNSKNKISLLYETGILNFILPELLGFEQAYETIIKELDFAEASIRLAIFLKVAGEASAKEILHRFKFDNKTIISTLFLIQHHTVAIENNAYAIKKFLSLHGRENFENWLHIKTAKAVAISHEVELTLLQSIRSQYNEIIARGDCFNLKMLAFNGSNLKDLGVPQGEKIGEILTFLLEEVLKSPEKNTAEALKKMC